MNRFPLSESVPTPLLSTRIAIVGNSGSGKSTLASAIAQGRGWPTLDLDTVAWEPEKVAVARSEAAARVDVERFCTSREEWIVEGCYANLVAVSLRHSPLLVFMHPGMERCLENCRRRPWEAHKFRSRAEQDERLEALLAWVRDYYTRSGPLSLEAHEALFERYPGPKRRFTEPIVSAADVLEVSQSRSSFAR